MLARTPVIYEELIEHGVHISEIVLADTDLPHPEIIAKPTKKMTDNFFLFMLPPVSVVFCKILN